MWSRFKAILISTSVVIYILNELIQSGLTLFIKEGKCMNQKRSNLNSCPDQRVAIYASHY